MNRYTYRGQVLAVHDGDSVRIDLDLIGIAGRHHDVDLGFDVHLIGHRLRLREDVRLLGCNARELAQPGGQEARDHLAQLLPIGTWVTVQTFKPDKFGGRWLAKITAPNGSDVSAQMVHDGYAAVWDGVGPKPVPDWPMLADAGTSACSTSDTDRERTAARPPHSPSSG
jgi:endonuclease YncB( thermonuclease family)